MSLPDQVLLLKQQYDSAKAHPAFVHLFSMIEGIKEQYEDAVLNEYRDRHGNDQTRELRFALRAVKQIMAIPETIDQAEEDVAQFMDGVAGKPRSEAGALAFREPTEERKAPEELDWPNLDQMLEKEMWQT